MGEDELATLETLNSYKETMSELIQQYGGRVVDSVGDNLLAEFSSVVDTVQCAVDIQQVISSKNEALPENRIMNFRIGINLGDVIEEGDRIYGDGVNIAARVESLAKGGGISLSGTAYDQLGKKLPLSYEYLGEQSVKNIEKPVRVYRVLTEAEAAGKVIGEKRRRPKQWRWAAMGAVAVLIIVAGILAIRYFYFRPAFEPASVERMAYPLPNKPSIAVLAFENMSGDPEQEFFSDGISEEIITALSKTEQLFVIARNSTFIYKGKPVKVQQVAEELGVRYVLEGSVRKSGDQVRITAQLVDALKGQHLWAERYDRELKDIFILQDEITQQIVSALGVKFEQIEHERALRKDPADLNAYDYNLRGWWHFKRFTKEDNEQARRMFEKAIEIEPKFAEAHAGLGLTYYESHARHWSQDPHLLELALDLGKKAIALDDTIPSAYSLLSHVYLWKKQHTQAITTIKKKITLDPNDAYGYADLAETLVWAGKPAEALELVKKAMRLNPHYPVNYLFTLGFANFAMERYEESVAALKGTLTRSPDHLGAHLVLATIYSEIGRIEEARAHVAEAMRINPQLSLEDLRQRLPALPKNGLDALRKAGLN
jgi:adenylate cyclase